MKRTLSLIALLALGAAATVQAMPLARKEIPAGTKWLIHLDIDAFRGTQLGGWLNKEFLTKFLAQQVEGNPGMSNVLANVSIEKLNSITAYGDGFETGPEMSGVLQVKMDAQLQTQLAQILAAQAVMDTNTFKVIKTDSNPLYSIGGQLFLSAEKNGVVLLGKSREHLEQTQQVRAGQKPDLSTAVAFNQYPGAEEGFFFLGVAEAFNEKMQIPPQAQILKMTEGGQIRIGEKAENLYLNLVLKSKTAEVTSQIQQVVQGMVALLTLAQPEQPELQKLAQGLSVNSTDRFVTLGVKYPVEEAIKHLKEEMSDEKPAKMNKEPKEPKVKKEKKKKKKLQDGDGQGEPEKKDAAEPVEKKEGQ